MSAALPTPADAYENLYAGVRARVIFDKLAAAGYEVRTDEQARSVLDTIDGLRALRQQTHAKQASADPFASVQNSLQPLLAKHGLVANKQAADDNARYVRHAATELAADPTIFNSVLALKAAEAEEMRAATAGRR